MPLVINGPATAGPGGFQPAVRNPTYTNGVITGSGSTPGANDLPVPGNPGNPAVNRSGITRAILQAILMNRADPYNNRSLEEDELRRSAMSRLRGE